jgi:hypothetical protein
MDSQKADDAETSKHPVQGALAVFTDDFAN